MWGDEDWLRLHSAALPNVPEGRADTAACPPSICTSHLGISLAVLMIYWTAALIETESQLELLLLPLPTVIVGGVVWTPAAWLTLGIAERQKGCKIGGPGTQALAMATLFLPVILATVAVPSMLGLDQAWSAVSLTLAGVLLSAVVAEPFRRFLLEWGNLTP